MPIFTSSQERQLWLWVLAIVFAIFSTLLIGKPILSLFSSQNVQAAIFLIGIALISGTVIFHAINIKPKGIEITIWLGVVATYIMFFLRLGLAERTHLIEYSVLAIFIFNAVNERMGYQIKKIIPAFYSFILTSLIGIIDEGIQMFLPARVFDAVDILFNCSAAAMAIGASLLLRFIHNFLRNYKEL